MGKTIKKINILYNKKKYAHNIIIPVNISVYWKNTIAYAQAKSLDSPSNEIQSTLQMISVNTYPPKISGASRGCSAYFHLQQK